MPRNGSRRICKNSPFGTTSCAGAFAAYSYVFFSFFEWGYTNGKHTNSACGVALSMRKTIFNDTSLKAVMCPDDPEIQARCGGVYYFRPHQYSVGPVRDVSFPK